MLRSPDQYRREVPGKRAGCGCFLLQGKSPLIPQLFHTINSHLAGLNLPSVFYLYYHQHWHLLHHKHLFAIVQPERRKGQMDLLVTPEHPCAKPCSTVHLAPSLHSDFPRMKMQLWGQIGASCSYQDQWATISRSAWIPSPLHANRDGQSCAYTSGQLGDAFKRDRKAGRMIEVHILPYSTTGLSKPRDRVLSLIDAEINLCNWCFSDAQLTLK